MGRLSPAEQSSGEGAASAQRKRSDRRPVTLRGHLVREAGEVVELDVLDLSYNGCGIEVAAPLPPGEKVKLSVLRRGTIDAQVRWCSGGKAGLVFDAETNRRSEQSDSRERAPFAAEVTAKRLGSTRYSTQILDASPEGCSIEVVDRPAIGEIMLVKFTGLQTIEAKVCSANGPTAKLRFAKPIHPAVFELMAKGLGM